MRFLTAVLVVFMAAIPSMAAVQDDIRSDSALIGKWFGKQIGEAIAFNGASNPQLPGNVCKLLGAEVGVSGVVSVSQWDTDEFRKLPLSSFDNANKDVISLPKDIPLPSWVAHAKVGLPLGLDLGVKYGTFDMDKKTADSKSEFSNSVTGVEIRKRLIGGDGLSDAVIPDLALSVAYDMISGDVKRTEPYGAALLGGQTLTADTTWKSEWDVKTITARLVLSQKILIVTPFIGGGVTANSGDVETTVQTLGTVSTGGVVAESVKEKVKINNSNVHFLGGVEIALFPLVRLNVSGVTGGDHKAVSAGLRAQFR
ncbi:MAG TPA: hypothetical protein PK876_06610 [Elusimicrobiota bacterium]|nr:hypothetical protein [Elusimicrobiota bacterium]